MKRFVLKSFQSIDGIVLSENDKFYLIAAFIDFSPDGYAIIPKDKIEEILDSDNLKFAHERIKEKDFYDDLFINFELPETLHEIFTKFCDIQ